MRSSSAAACLVLACALTPAVSACKSSVSALKWRVHGLDGGTPGARYEVTIARGGCGSGETVYQRVLHSPSEMSDPPPVLSSGQYGFWVRVIDATCRVTASGCSEVSVPSDDDRGVDVYLERVGGPVLCAADRCEMGECHTRLDGGPSDAGASDGGALPDARPSDARVAVPDGGDAGRTCGRDCGECARCEEGRCVPVAELSTCGGGGGSCRNGLCCTGCWNGTACVAGTSAAGCGTRGGSCTVCGCAGDACTAGACSPSHRAATVSAGESHVCAIDEGHALWCWGQGEGGALGLGSAAIGIAAPTRVGTGATWQTVDAGLSFTCATAMDGTLWCWGRNELGQLGLSDRTTRTAPVQVTSPGTWSLVSTGRGHACGLRDRRAVCWGANDRGQLGTTRGLGASTPSPIASSLVANLVSLVAGGDGTCAVDDAGRGYCWGDNQRGQLGIGTHDTIAHPTPTAVAPGMRLTWATIVTSGTHACGRAAVDGALSCWGRGLQGQLGQGDSRDAYSPVAVLGGLAYTAVAASEALSFGVSGSRLYSWGTNAEGALGDPGVAATRIMPGPSADGFVDWVGVSAGAGFACGIRVDGTLWCWGDGADGQLGTGAATSTARMPVRVCF